MKFNWIVGSADAADGKREVTGGLLVVGVGFSRGGGGGVGRIRSCHVVVSVSGAVLDVWWDCFMYGVVPSLGSS